MDDHGFDAQPLRRHCFAVRGRLTVADTPAPITLKPRPAEALATLLPLLGCGEEAAAMAFDGLAERHTASRIAHRALHAIAAEEREHDLIIRQLETALPAPPHAATMLATARRFHVRLASGGATAHLARIAALDSAVCTVLSGLLRDDRPVASDPIAHAALRRIHRDEARHVQVSRNLAMAAGVTRPITDAAAEAREALANILALAADAFEALAVDPAALDRSVRHLPNGLLA